MYQSRIFTMTAGGRPFFSFSATTYREATSLAKEQWPLDELLTLRFDDHPLWDGKSHLAVREALTEEEIAYWAKAKNNHQDCDDLFMAYLVKLDGSEITSAVEAGAFPPER